MLFNTYPDGYVKSDVVLSVGLLVSNNIKYIRKAMEGLRPLLEAVPSELVIVETVGEEHSDGSIDVCREYTDKIYHFDWINDFSAARNEILKHCSGEWFMYQDDDEYFEDVKELVSFFNSDERFKYNSGFYYTHDMIETDRFSTAIAGRMVRRRPDTHFIWKVHEGFNEANVPGKQFSSYTVHFGYLYQTEEDRLRKSKRNLTLLLEEEKEHKAEPRLLGQIVQEYMMVPDLREEGMKKAEEYINVLVKAGKLGNSMTQWIIAAKARNCLMNKDVNGLVEYVDEAYKKYKLSDYCKLAMSSNIIEAAGHYGGISLKRVDEACDEYFRICDYFDTHHDEKLMQTQLDFPKFDEPVFRSAIAEISAQYKNALGKYEEALALWKRVDFSLSAAPWGCKEVILDTLQHLDNPALLAEFYGYFMRPEVFEAGNEKFLPLDLYKMKFNNSEE